MKPFLFNPMTVLLLLYALMMPACMYAESIESPAAIQAEVEAFVTSTVHHEPNEELMVHIPPLDPALHLGTCRSNHRISFLPNTLPEQANSVHIACDSEPQWQLYVPVRIQILTPVVVAKQTLLPGLLLTKSCLTYAKKDKNLLYNDYFKKRSELIGLSTTRQIQAGMPLTIKNTRKMALIKRNQPVTLVFKKGSIEIAMSGIAKSDGYLNESVQIMNPSSKKIIDALVTGSGTAEIIG